MIVLRVLMKVVSLVAISLLCLKVSVAQSPPENTLQAGSVVEISSSPDQSYAAYLPTSYTADKKWPAVFCLDPRARGKTAAERFSSAAEKYGYVVFCSNNSRNGLYGETITKIVSEFWLDAHKRFSIDENRTYFAGFSGGSRLAANYAVGCQGCVAGVLASGAGFPASLTPNQKTRFAYFGVVGVDDFNFGEMRELEKKFSALESPYHFQNFNAGHEWAPPASLEVALAWFSLQAMRSGKCEKDEKFIDQQYAARVTEAERLLAVQQLIDSQKSFQSIVRDFENLRDVKLAAEKAAQLRKSAELRKEEQAEGELFQRQLREAGEIRMLWMKAPDPDESRTPRYEANVRLNDWRKKKELTTDSRERRLARRILSHLLVESYEAAQANLREQKDYSLAIGNFQLARAIEPQSPNLAYELARVYALNRDKKMAIQVLEEAVGLGFKDPARIKSDEAFSALSGEARFQKLLLKLN